MLKQKVLQSSQVSRIQSPHQSSHLHQIRTPVHNHRSSNHPQLHALIKTPFKSSLFTPPLYLVSSHDYTDSPQLHTCYLPAHSVPHPDLCHLSVILLVVPRILLSSSLPSLLLQNNRLLSLLELHYRSAISSFPEIKKFRTRLVCLCLFMTPGLSYISNKEFFFFNSLKDHCRIIG